MKTYILPEKSRTKLQKIWGKPLFGTETEVDALYQKLIAKKKYKTVITVGDYCSHRLQSDIKIFDKKVQRRAFDQEHECSLNVKNPPGTIQKEVWDIVRQAIKDKANVCVDGEEDLVVIPTVLLAKPKTLIIYGFPNKGVCFLEPDSATKTLFRKTLKELFLPVR